MSSELTLRALTRRFPGATDATVDGLDLHITAGGCVALLGPSGSGKSTVLRMVAGLDTPDAGDVLVGGRSMAGVPTEARGTVLVFQRPRLFPHLDVLDNVAFPLAVAGVRRRRAREEARRFLDLVDAADLSRRRPGGLSGGQEQRIALARALAARADVILLDEPFSALDPAVRAEMHSLVVELRAAVEPTILLVTHDQHEAAVLADTVAVLLDGRIAQHDSTARLYSRPASLDVHAFLGGRNAVEGRVRDGAHHSPLGTLLLGRTHPVPDGPAHLTVRQESLRLTDTRDPEADVTGTVKSVAVQGPRAQVVVDVAGIPLTVEVSAGRTVPPAAKVGLVIPLDERHAIPQGSPAVVPAAPGLDFHSSSASRTGAGAIGPTAGAPQQR